MPVGLDLPYVLRFLQSTCRMSSFKPTFWSANITFALMPLLFLAIAPFLLTLGLATSPRISAGTWLFVIGCVACIEGIVFWSQATQSFNLEFLYLWCLVILLPWEVASLTLWIFRYTKHRFFIVICFPLTYFSCFVCCLALATYVFKSQL